jgi:hypothetical protein
MNGTYIESTIPNVIVNDKIDIFTDPSIYF